MTGNTLAASESSLPNETNHLIPSRDTSSTASGSRESVVLPIPCPGEPHLFQIPAGITPIYRALSWPLQCLLGALSTSLTLLTAGVSWNQMIWEPLRVFRHGVHVAQVARFLLQLVAIYMTSYAVLQEIVARPSRVSVDQLRSQYHLPSSLSRYRNVSKTGVHLVEYEAPYATESSQPTPIITGPPRILYVNHGFGASSLSWLPALPPLVEALKCKVGLGHDAVGFGFTQRTDDYYPYTSQGSADIGLNLLRKDHSRNASSFILMGHSMGAITTLHMALGLPADAEKRIILVAPALGLRKSSKKKPLTREKPWSPYTLLDVPASYILRRAVGRPNFWRNSLALAWGDAKRLSDADVLRFQWPSIGKGWEKGLLRFVRAQRSEISDQELLSRVLDLPNLTSVHVIVGSNDRIVSPKRVREFLAAFPSVPVVELATLGHDPFEEDTKKFVDTVAALLN